LEELIGYIPKDDAADLVDQSKKNHEKIPQDETPYQGGGYVEFEGTGKK
jgi:uronate dehydrogenase